MEVVGGGLVGGLAVTLVNAGVCGSLLVYCFEGFAGFGTPVTPFVEPFTRDAEVLKGLGDAFAVFDDLFPGAAEFESGDAFFHC